MSTRKICDACQGEIGDEDEDVAVMAAERVRAGTRWKPLTRGFDFHLNCWQTMLNIGQVPQ